MCPAILVCKLAPVAVAGMLATGARRTNRCLTSGTCKCTICMLATFAFDEADQAQTCRLALDAAVEAMEALEERNKARVVLGLPTVSVDLALHVGEVLYGNVGAADRLDFTVIGPAVNEVARIEKLCDLLDRKILVSAPFASAAGHCDGRLESLGNYVPRGVSEAKEIFGLAPQRKVETRNA